jgi:hypothetical protein
LALYDLEWYTETFDVKEEIKYRMKDGHIHSIQNDDIQTTSNENSLSDKEIEMIFLSQVEALRI